MTSPNSPFWSPRRLVVSAVGVLIMALGSLIMLTGHITGGGWTVAAGAFIILVANPMGVR